MTSQTGTHESWQPGDNHDILPTLIVYREENSRQIEALKQKVTSRLRPYLEVGAVQWLAWPGPCDDGSSETSIVEACASFLTLDLWQRLVDKGYQSNLPDLDFTARVQVILIWDALTCEPSDADDATAALSEVLKAKEKLVGQMIEILPILIWLGECEGVSEVYRSYWPRIQLDTKALGGTTVKPQRVYQVCEHLLVALVSTELTRALDHILQGKKDKVEWFVLGASALITDPQRMQHWLEAAVLKRVLEHHIATSLTDVQKHQIEKAVETRAMIFRRAALAEAADALRESRWQVDLDEENLTIQRCILNSTELREATFGSYQPSSLRGGMHRARFLQAPFSFLQDLHLLLTAVSRPFVPGRNLVDILAGHYAELSNFLEGWFSGNKKRGLAPRVDEERGNLKDFLAAFLDRGPLPVDKLPVFQVSDGSLPRGLAAARFAVMRMRYYLVQEGDFNYHTLDLDEAEVTENPVQEVRSTFLEPGFEAHQRIAAEIAATEIQGYVRRYHHFVRTLASLPGVLLQLLPAWPLATYLLSLLPEWGIGRSLVVSGISLLLIGVIELIYWWLIRARRGLDKNQEKAYHALVSKSLLPLVAYTMQDYRLWVVHHLRETEALLQDLYAVFEEEYWQAERVYSTLDGSHINDNSYYLQRDQVWLEEKVQSIVEDVNTRERGKYEDYVTAVIGKEFWPWTERPRPARVVLEGIVKAYVDEIVKLGREELKPGVIAEDEDLLKNGKRWQWLWQRAQPLGSGRLSEPFTIILAPAEYVMGASGQENKDYWKQDSMVAYTRQMYEEICVRGAVRWRGGED